MWFQRVPANICRASNIPPGRVAQRLQAFQNEPNSSSASSRGTLKARVPVEPTPQISTSNLAKNEFHEPEAPPETQQSRPEADSAKYEEVEVEERGRTLQRGPMPDVDSEDEARVDQVLENVRSRLYSVQHIVRRERSGSSQARDDLMDELGSMLDNAIATTMSPLPRSPHLPTRISSSKRPSPTKQSIPTTLSRSQSLKLANPNPSRPLPKEPGLLSSPEKKAPQPSPARTAAKIPPTVITSAAVRQLFEKDLMPQRQRQASEPLAFTARRTGFPLSSPVRERALLWESMSRRTISEQDTPKSSPNIARFHPVSPERKSEEPPKLATPPIPLALPQLLDAEKRQQQARLQEEATLAPKDDGTNTLPDLDPVRRASSIELPGCLSLKEVGAGTPTVQETPSFVQPAEYDEHHQKPRPSVVRTTIKDILSATKRRVSGKSTQALTPAIDKDDGALVRESELRGSILDLESMDARHLPPLQATPEEVAKVQSIDGTCLVLI